MHDLRRVTALGGAEPQVDRFDHVTIAENDSLALASIAARMSSETQCHSTLKEILAVVPGPGKAVFNNPNDGFWMGPDQWMITAPSASHELLADRLKESFGSTASVTEQSGAWVCFDLTGPGIADVTERLCAAPIRKMTSGDAVRSVIHQLGCFLIFMPEGEHLRIFGPRASAGTLHHALITSARSTA